MNLLEQDCTSRARALRQITKRESYYSPFAPCYEESDLKRSKKQLLNSMNTQIVVEWQLNIQDTKA